MDTVLIYYSSPLPVVQYCVNTLCVQSTVQTIYSRAIVASLKQVLKYFYQQVTRMPHSFIIFTRIPHNYAIICSSLAHRRYNNMEISAPVYNYQLAV